MDKVKFEESTHTYTNEQGRELISVTTLLRVAGISPNYDFVNEEILKAAAERGTLIHKEIEEYVKEGKIGFTNELHSFIEYVKSNDLRVIASEKTVNNDCVAGTLDLILKKPNGKLIYADIKTTSTIHTQAVSWQLSIYKDLDRCGEDADLQCWHFDKNGNLQVKDVLEVAPEHLDRLYESVRTGNLFVIQADANVLAELYEVEQMIAYFEIQKQKAEENAKALRESIVKSMKEQGVTKFENDKIIISYIAPSSTTRFDSVQFKKDHPDTYEKYVKVVPTKEQVRIKLKESKDE